MDFSWPPAWTHHKVADRPNMEAGDMLGARKGWKLWDGCASSSMSAAVAGLVAKVRDRGSLPLWFCATNAPAGRYTDRARCLPRLRPPQPRYAPGMHGTVAAKPVLCSAPT